MQTIKKKSLTVKDLVTVGIFSALYQGRHALAGRIADTGRLSESPGYDNQLRLCAAADSGKQGSGRAFHCLGNKGH